MPGTFVMGQRDFEDFYDQDILAPPKRKNYMTYSPGSSRQKKNYSLLERKDTLS